MFARMEQNMNRVEEKMDKIDNKVGEKMDKIDGKLAKLQSSLDYSLPIIGLTATGLGAIVIMALRSFLCVFITNYM